MANLPENATRDEHLAWAKREAFRLLDKGTAQDAYFNFLGNLNGHRDLMHHPNRPRFGELFRSGQLSSVERMRANIEEFH